MEKLSREELSSLNIKDEQIKKLKESFPEVFTEGNKVDWDKLRLTLGEQVDVGKERFGMNWPGKSDCFKTIQQPSIATLVPAREESVDFDTTQNLFIEGDNLEVLKLLQKSYLGKIKMIYIDPPYNTGNEFIYPDNYSENIQTYLEYTGQIDTEGRKFSTNVETDGRFHSKWMNMMYPRLFLAKNLLTEDGVIFISIDDHEIDNLKKICNDIFGEENFISSISRVMKSGGAKGNFFTPNIDFILVYSRNKMVAKNFSYSLNKDQIGRYYNKIEENGERKGELYGEERLYKASLDPRPNQRYWIKCPDESYAIPPGVTFPKKLEEGEKITPTSEDGVWKWIYDSYKKELDAGNIVFKKTSTTALVDADGNQSKWNIYNKVWLKDQQEKGMVPPNFISDFENRQSASELKDLGIPFDFAKPSNLIKYLARIVGLEEDDTILDFFAGASSTAHAILRYNLEQTSKCKFICVQLPEPTEEGSEPFKTGFRTIADISKERIRRVIKEIRKENSEDNNMFKRDISETDLGFRVFKLQSSNFKLWKTDVDKNQEAIAKQLELNISHISPEATQEAILFELLLKSGFELTTTIHRETITEKTVYGIAEGELMVCLERELTTELIKSIAEKKPSRVICLDEGFQNNDQLKTNAVQIMKSKGVTKFQTV